MLAKQKQILDLISLYKFLKKVPIFVFLRGSYKKARACFIIGDKDEDGGMSCNMLNTAPGLL